EKGQVPKDPWGNDYVYLSPGAQGDYDIISYGADGVAGGDGKNEDINNWDLE
ncbi:MAG: type II secretion system protein GspG, partial [Desulfobulbales bacterium]